MLDHRITDQGIRQDNLRRNYRVMRNWMIKSDARWGGWRRYFQGTIWRKSGRNFGDLESTQRQGRPKIFVGPIRPKHSHILLHASRAHHYTAYSFTVTVGVTNVIKFVSAKSAIFIFSRWSTVVLFSIGLHYSLDFVDPQSFMAIGPIGTGPTVPNG